MNPSPGNFFVASMPSLPTLAVSLVAWASTSEGPWAMRLSRCGWVLAQGIISHAGEGILTHEEIAGAEGGRAFQQQHGAQRGQRRGEPGAVQLAVFSDRPVGLRKGEAPGQFLRRGGDVGILHAPEIARLRREERRRGGDGRLQRSPGRFSVASKPGLLPLAISRVAWSGASLSSAPADVSQPARHARRRTLEEPHGRHTRPRAALRARSLARLLVRELTDQHGFFEGENLLGGFAHP